MKQAIFLSLCLVFLSLVSPAFACKEFVAFPDHLSKELLNLPSNYYVVNIESIEQDRFTGVLVEKLGSRQVIGKQISMKFRTGEEGHAVCPLTLMLHKTFLLRSDSQHEPFLVSRFHPFNIGETHEKFATYLQDLKAVASR